MRHQRVITQPAMPKACSELNDLMAQCLMRLCKLKTQGKYPVVLGGKPQTANPWPPVICGGRFRRTT